MENYIAFNIQWDTDGSREIFDELPKEVIIPNYITEEGNDQDETLELISDYISDTTGYCHKGFEVRKENKNMKTFKLPVTYSVWGYVNVEAETIEDAIQYFKENSDDIELPLDVDTEYVDGSFELSSEDKEYIEFLNKEE